MVRKHCGTPSLCWGLFRRCVRVRLCTVRVQQCARRQEAQPTRRLGDFSCRRSDMSHDQKKAAADLHFTSETWGLQWAFLDRIFRKDTSLIKWDVKEMTSSEKKHLASLGWNASNWDDAAAPAQGVAAPWEALSAEQRACEPRRPLL